MQQETQKAVMRNGTCPGGMDDSKMLRKGNLGHHGYQRNLKKKIKKGDKSRVILHYSFHEDVEVSRGRECVSLQSPQNSRDPS